LYTNVAAGNTAVGRYAMHGNTTGFSNVAMGVSASVVSTIADKCVSIGADSHLRLTEGDENTAVGCQAGAYITTGTQNVMIGQAAGVTGTTTTTGSNNVFVGHSCHGSGVGVDAEIVLGFNVGGGGTNTLRFGNAANDCEVSFGGTSISAPSDIRLKENIEDETIGLSFINELRPVTFQWKKAKDISSEMEAHDPDSEERVMNGKFNHGFIAQEVKAVIDNHSDIKDGFAMWKEDAGDGRQRIADGALVPMLVKAIQELSAEIEILKAK